jgi:hypothetical protein
MGGRRDLASAASYEAGLQAGGISVLPEKKGEKKGQETCPTRRTLECLTMSKVDASY